MHSRVKPENVPLMRCVSSHLAGHHPIERNSHKTFGFSPRFWCFNKRSSTSDEPGGARHIWVVFCRSEEAVEFAGNQQLSPAIMGQIAGRLIAPVEVTEAD